MTLNIEDLLDMDELNRMLHEGRIRIGHHESLPLRILNYTSKAQYADEWTNAERVCRGLIVTQWGEVIARGMPKFFNYGSPHGPEFLPTDVGLLTKKQDGSLGIGWAYAGEIGIATRGSFHSDQAQKATSMMTDIQRGQILRRMDEGRSMLFEIVYPDNRIVVEYGDREENIPIAVVDNATGQTGLYELNTVAAISTLLTKPIPDTEEGYVVSVPSKGLFKLKGETYLNLHKLMFGLTEKAVWEMLQSHNVAEREQYVNQFPPITQQWVKRKMFQFGTQHHVRSQIVIGIAVEAAKQNGGLAFERKDVALWLKDNYPEYLGEVFAFIDGGDEKLTPLVWKKIKPAHKPYKAQEETE